MSRARFEYYVIERKYATNDSILYILHAIYILKEDMLSQ